MLAVAITAMRDLLLRGRPGSGAAVAATGYGALIVACMIAIRADRISWAELGIRVLTARSLVVGIGAGILMVAPLWRLPLIAPSRQGWLLVAVIVEEVVFRGVLFALLRRSGGLPLAIAGSAAAFTVAHAASAAWPSIVLVALAGICLGILRAIRGDLWASGIAHLIIDLFSLP